MVPDDASNLCVVIDFRQDSLAYRGVRFHLPALVECERTFLFKQTGGKANLANVVHHPRKVREVTGLRREPHTRRNIARVDRNGCRVAGGVPVPCVERRDERRRERKVRPLEADVYCREVLGESTLLLIQHEEALGGERWREEQRQRPRRDLRIQISEQPDDGRVHGYGHERQRQHHLHDLPNCPRSAKCDCDRAECCI